MYRDPLVVEVDGRTLTVEDAGPSGGFPVLVHCGGGSRHLEPATVREARNHGLRLISYDRPSYGGSTPVPGRVIADCAPDVKAILSALGISRIAVWGFSGGGPYALATAALLPDAVAAVCVLASLGPYGAPGLDFLDGMDDSYREEVRIFFEDRAAARATFQAEAAEMYDRLSRPEGWLTLWGDRAGTDPAHGMEIAQYLADGFRDGWTRGDEGWWDDWSAFLTPWGLELNAITAPVSLWHGLADNRCPPSHGRWLAEQIPASPLTSRPMMTTPTSRKTTAAPPTRGSAGPSGTRPARPVPREDSLRSHRVVPFTCPIARPPPVNWRSVTSTAAPKLQVSELPDRRAATDFPR